MIAYGGFGMANAMFTIVPIFIGVVFVLILAGIAVQAVRGAAQWKRNNDAPVLTVEAEVAAGMNSAGKSLSPRVERPKRRERQ